MRYLIYVTIPLFLGCLRDYKARKVLADLSQKTANDNPTDPDYGKIAKEASRIADEGFYDGFDLMGFLTDESFLAIAAIVMSGGAATPLAAGLLKKKKT